VLCLRKMFRIIIVPIFLLTTTSTAHQHLVPVLLGETVSAEQARAERRGAIDVHCTGVKVDGAPSTYNVDSLGGMLKVSDSKTIALIGMDMVDGKTARVAGVNVPGSEKFVQAAGQACLDQNGAAAASSPAPALVAVPIAAHEATSASTMPQVTFNATGDEATVSGGSLRWPVKLRVDYRAEKKGQPIPSGLRFEVDEDRGSQLPVKITNVTFNGGLEPASAGAHVGSFITGGLRATANRFNTHADAVVGVCKNPDDCFTQVEEVGSSKTTRTVGGHEQGEFVTATGRDPIAFQEAKTINDISYALAAIRQAEQLAHASVLQSAMATPRFEREVRAIEKIRTAAGFKAQP
jgi:hypothetical protein